MKFEDFIKLGQVRKGSRDENLAKSLIKQTGEDVSFFDSLEITKKSARKLVSNYYDFLRSILEAIAALEGYKIYGHEAYTFFLKEKGEEIFSLKFDRFKKIRNKINYYAGDIAIEEAKEVIDDIKSMINVLKGKYLKEFKEND